MGQLVWLVGVFTIGYFSVYVAYGIYAVVMGLYDYAKDSRNPVTVAQRRMDKVLASAQARMEATAKAKRRPFHSWWS